MLGLPWTDSTLGFLLNMKEVKLEVSTVILGVVDLVSCVHSFSCCEVG